MQLRVPDWDLNVCTRTGGCDRDRRGNNDRIAWWCESRGTPYNVIRLADGAATNSRSTVVQGEGDVDNNRCGNS